MCVCVCVFEMVRGVIGKHNNRLQENERDGDALRLSEPNGSNCHQGNDYGRKITTILMPFVLDSVEKLKMTIKKS